MREIAIRAVDAPPKKKQTGYPEPFASRMKGRMKYPLGDLFGLKNFGVNLTRLEPGGLSALRHAHTKQDEFIYILEGRPTLITNSGETALEPGMCAGFPCATGDAHHLVNRTSAEVVYLEIGDRLPGDSASYPDDDIAAQLLEDGSYRFTRKDGTPY
jgi:uncharacterized cupin superfamily protein